jgi:hypothetical protein
MLESRVASRLRPCGRAAGIIPGQRAGFGLTDGAQVDHRVLEATRITVY